MKTIHIYRSRIDKILKVMDNLLYTVGTKVL